MKNTLFLVVTNGVVSSDAYTTLKGACDELGVSYRMAIRGKREFKGNRVIVQATIIKSATLVRKGIKFFKKRSNDVRNTD